MLRINPVDKESEIKERLLSAALFEFADRGIATATLRNITDRAGANIAAVNYHFGSKEGLIQSVLEKCLVPLNHLRRQSLSAWQAKSGGTGDLPGLVEAFVRPPVDISVDSNGGRAPIRLLLQVRAVPQPLTNSILGRELDGMHREFLAAFRKTLPQLSAKEVAMRYDFARGATLQILSDLDPTARDLPDLSISHSPEENEHVVRQLVQFITAGFMAPRLLPFNQGAKERRKRTRQPKG